MINGLAGTIWSKMEDVMKFDDNELITVAQWCEHYKWPSPRGIRKYISKAVQYKLDSAIVRIGRRVLIRPNLFFELIYNHANDAKRTTKKKSNEIVEDVN